MSKTISYKGKVNIDVEEQIRLKTNTGKTGYKITKFQILSTTPGVNSHELVGKVTSVPDPNVGPTVDLSNSDVLAVAYHTDLGNANVATSDSIIIDNAVVNQDVFVQIGNATGGTTPANYYIEMETMPLNDMEQTKLTLQSVRQLLSR